MASKQILLVEDNPDDVDLTLRAFKKQNLVNKVDVVHDGEQALDYLYGKGAYSDKKPPCPSVILLDLKLPKINGLEVLRRIKKDECLKVIPTVILTSSREDRDLVESYKYGANSYVRKPVDFDQFNKAILELGMYWLLLNEDAKKCTDS